MGASAQPQNSAIEQAKTDADEGGHGDKRRDQRSAPESRRDQPRHMQKNTEQNQTADQTKRAKTLTDALVQKQAERYQRANHQGGGY
jgi:hypothetical protein